MYVWDYEYINVYGKIHKFIVVDVLEFPVELVSSDGSYYALQIKNSEDGELWFLIDNIPRKTLVGYLKGKLEIGKLFTEGRVSVVKRKFNDYNTFINTDIAVENFRLPDSSLKLEVWDWEVYENFRQMFDKPLKNLLKMDKISFELEKSMSKIESHQPEIYKHESGLKIQESMLLAA